METRIKSASRYPIFKKVLKETLNWLLFKDMADTVSIISRNTLKDISMYINFKPLKKKKKKNYLLKIIKTFNHKEMQ
jgi:hypothetical protein